MNLYRSFGNLMENWVAEQNPYPDLLDNIPEDSSPSPSRKIDTRAESVDSGVETASTDTLFPTSSLSIDMADLDSFASGHGYDYKAISSLGSASLPSYSAPRALSKPASPNRVQGSAALNQKLRQALQRSESRRQSRQLSTDRPQTRYPLKRSESFGLWETDSSSVPVGPTSDTDKRILSLRSRMDQTQGKLEGRSQIDSTDLSPGFIFLEQVCQMLEDRAKKKIANGEHVDKARFLRRQSSNSLHSLDQPPHLHGARLERQEEPKLEEDPYGQFRPRSASDTTIAPVHLRKLKLGLRGQQLSTFNLLDHSTKDDKIRVDIPDKSNKKYMLKIVSLKRDEPRSQEKNSQLMQSLERNTTHRKLSQVFRKRWSTLPIPTAH
ncbi:uncharacterized protein si:dkey-106l3.7 [Corythoichthys intestinalis]|uniref:uncharacterized protein si:dkey-106l3.7 n=1 Tax=Corythoichthys intestinalis TaxID=161448 RepID=UPI0025A608CD|nr:uncharacterized protein si:dkey-106l3.7 [Corythoichthys intestinalis]